MVHEINTILKKVEDQNTSNPDFFFQEIGLFDYKSFVETTRAHEVRLRW